MVKIDCNKGKVMVQRRQGRMAKTQTVPVRLDPVLKWAAELAAGKERRSLNSFVEWAVEQAVKRVNAGVGYNETGDRVAVSAWDIANECWHVMPMKRLDELGQKHPESLTVKERAIYQAMGLIGICNDSDLYQNSDIWLALEQFGAEEIDFDELKQRIDLILESRQP
jgi:hypothetical protein